VPLYQQFSTVPLVSISMAQRAPLKPLGVRWAATVYHGLPTERFPFASQDRGYLAFLGRLSPEKQPDVAIEIARRVGLPLKIAAKIDAVDREYFDRTVAPLLDDPLVEFLGEIGDEDKAEFLGGARALLFPIDWPEPFGLVMIEAMACGTPVVATAAGALPEVVGTSGGGILVAVDSADALARGIRSLLAQPAARAELGALGRKGVLAAYSWPSVAQRTAEAYAELLEERRGRPASTTTSAPAGQWRATASNASSAR
jgi:glycosyltransferase involved in cell wall biosynthesis